MTTESKKLQTTLGECDSSVTCPSCRAGGEVFHDGHALGFLCVAADSEMVDHWTIGNARAVLHDARIAHEQREVIRQLEDALRCMRSLVPDGRFQPSHAKGFILRADAALAAAVPFLAEDGVSHD